MYEYAQAYMHPSKNRDRWAYSRILKDIQIYKTQKYDLNNSVFYLFLYLSLFISKLLALVTN